jgi:hypothetical protein
MRVRSSGSGASSTSRGRTRSGRSYSRWNPRTRPAITTSPLDQSASSITLAGFQFHIPPLPVPSKSRDASGPRSLMAERISSASSGCFASTSPRHGWLRDIAGRKSGQSSAGIKHASCAQYSKTRPVESSCVTVSRG